MANAYQKQALIITKIGATFENVRLGYKCIDKHQKVFYAQFNKRFMCYTNV